ncbi:TIGR01777 family oxidoreductase [Corynebacterium kozikiae]|uniref:TIGR01777 family oxidoreductase n=1 Tax=Corynebacterium kozikiae TaxID=2968469 RepID=UPI00211CE20A|nr:TIGR01777 family oxidoreductase [Corynebacterium sp. 76QC2CO]MCQ9342784.1 TIGR01777 family oxidoreductase [Corynebacterium sp. 76QC2CO]
MAFHAAHIIPAPLDLVWDWHTRPGAVARLSPSFLPMTPVAQAESLARGTTTFALPAGLTWQAKHDLSGYIPGRQFTDVCVTAPVRALANWRHVHSFAPVTGAVPGLDAGTAEATVITDEVFTRVPGQSLVSLFAYRQHQLLGDIQRILSLQPLLNSPTDAASEGDNGKIRTVAMTGSRGLVGRALTAQLQTLGITVVQLVRSKPKDQQRLWNPESPHPELLQGVDALIHLAGEPIFGRFHDAHKAAIRDSRTGPTAALARLAAETKECKVMISASAIGWYGHDRGDEILQESSGNGEGFLAQVVKEWEAATQAATDGGVRTAQIRTGVVLSGRGGLLPVYKGLFNVGLGGSFAKRSPWLSWISIDDLTDIYVQALLDPALSGPINAVAPNPVSNTDFATALGKVLKRPSIIPLPSIAPKLILGAQGADELAFANQRVQPQVLKMHGFQFRHSTINQALAHELGGEELLPDPTKAEQPEETMSGHDQALDEALD